MCVYIQNVQLKKKTVKIVVMLKTKIQVNLIIFGLWIVQTWLRTKCLILNQLVYRTNIILIIFIIRMSMYRFKIIFYEGITLL